MNQTRKDRIADNIKEYDAQGIHRTGTPVDRVSAEWLAAKIEAIGLTPHIPGFSLDRVDVLQAQVIVDDRILEGVPLFDCEEYTTGDGITGKLGPIENEDADIGVAVVPPFPGNEPTRKFNEARRSGRFKAMVSITSGPSNGFFLANASDFSHPFGPPVLQVSSREGAGLTDAAEEGAAATVTAHAERVEAEAFNVETTVAGADENLPPLVVITPRSGWWECASERGGGIAAWLEMMRGIKNMGPDRDVVFTANTGHELHHLGMKHYLKSNPDILNRAYAWIHLGANFSACENSVFVVCADETLKSDFTSCVESVELNTAVGRPFGEAIPIYEHGGRFISVGGTNPWFHAPEDRWPNAVNLEQTARIVEGLIKFSCDLAKK